MSRKWKKKGNDVSVSFDSSKKVVYVNGDFVEVDEDTLAEDATITNADGETTAFNVALTFAGGKGNINERLDTLERNITILADALIATGGTSSTQLGSFTVNGFTFRGDGAHLAISYGGTDVFQLQTDGDLVVKKDVTAYGAP